MAYDFLDSLEVDSFAARAVQAIPRLKIAELVIVTTNTRVIHWVFEEGAETIRVPSVVETSFSSHFDRLTAPDMLEGEFQTFLFADCIC